MKTPYKKIKLLWLVSTLVLLIVCLWMGKLFLSVAIIVSSGLLYLLLQQHIHRQYSLFGAMKLALKNDAFMPKYQPIYDHETGKYCGAEILLRWHNHDNQIIMPDLFILEAETSGLIVPITLKITEQAFQECQNIFQHKPDFYLAINISAQHFKDEFFFDAFYALVARYHIDPKQIMFELTERDLLSQYDNIAIHKMLHLRQTGYNFAIDDYGTGHASISYLRSFPFNYLKIDKQFIQAIGSKAITESLNDAIIALANKLNLAIVAEGVESEEQMRYLTQKNVRYLQGWYFSKALTIDKLISLLQLDNS